MDIRELLRHLRQGESNRAIGRALGMNRKTVGRYRRWAGRQGLLKGELPSLERLERLLKETFLCGCAPQNVSSVQGFCEYVLGLRREGVEIAAIHQRLKERGYRGSYSSVYRFVRSLEPREPEAVVRVETKPGEEAQVDFGYAGKMIDPVSDRVRKSWLFVMTLSWSRHQYVEFVFDQKVETWLKLHRHSFEFFGGVPQRIVPDNLKAAILKACWHEPEAQQAYRECAQHYDFLIAPCRPRTPQHKGKVEKGGVHYVKRNFLAGRELCHLDQANRDVLHWIHETAGMRIHGTTKERPLERFEREKASLKPLPNIPYDIAVWKQLKVGRDCYVHFDNAYYSVPFRLVGQKVQVRGGCELVQIYSLDHRLITTHNRARKPGERLTHTDHLPPFKIEGVILTRENCRRKAASIGPWTKKMVDRLLDHRPEDRLRVAGRLLRLAQRYGPKRLEAAIKRALAYGETSYLSVKKILETGLDAEPIRARRSASGVCAFVRSNKELTGHLTGGLSWR
ncbi:MAG: IS21 family transposase [Deltaproteobacteria bacterium]|nr:IS21 family transposase [Deltaproteobacteria bacterium]